ncbi:hypothetical protein PR003_g26408 [Phytophthora rubi]|uniref:Uncharacterized protein n=1 Tax=Phytophthora rubi TaxID=129364 RepID=A0A6A3I5M1_9STRA|nr:hypothetical protein PR002_g25569 [Phytophthora rubi]KAE8977275.1 hypothetical protein PR001_g25175 [Phytophthora rubi]KAE9286098.1 hypothetical protein PR003_g26408 [Phytophthora rubi]
MQRLMTMFSASARGIDVTIESAKRGEIVTKIDTEAILAFVDKKDEQRRRHRDTMVVFRRKAKEKQKNLRSEHRRLEEHLKQLMTRKGAAASNCTKTHQPLTLRLHQFAVEIEALRKEKLELRKQLALHTSFHKVLLSTSTNQPDEGGSILPTNDAAPDWRVYFPGGEPSFHFYPFTRSDFDAVVDSCATELTYKYSATNRAGDFIGWNVHHAVVPSKLDSSFLLARARFTKRVHCSLPAAFEAMNHEEINSWPLIVMQMNWSGVSSSGASTVLLQQFDDNTFVLVHNVRSDFNLRYLCVVHRSRWTERDGKRAVTYAMVIADSEANKRSRLAEMNDDEVKWVEEGGAHLTFIEAEDNTIDVVYEHWGSCEDALHARYLFVQWANYALRWEQMVLSSKLLVE